MPAIAVCMAAIAAQEAALADAQVRLDALRVRAAERAVEAYMGGTTRDPFGADAETARGARAWNDANVLALRLRSTSEPLVREILDAWFTGEPSPDADDRANVEHIAEIETPA